jgi:hypothetical protein
MRRPPVLAHRRKINPITFDSTGQYQRRCAVASARCCRAGEWASRDETAVAQSEPHAASGTSDWNLQSGRSEEMTSLRQIAYDTG